MSEISRRSFLNFFRRPQDSPDATPVAEQKDKPPSFDLGDFYRQREILGLAGERPPSMPKDDLE